MSEVPIYVGMIQEDNASSPYTAMVVKAEELVGV